MNINIKYKYNPKRDETEIYIFNGTTEKKCITCNVIQDKSYFRNKHNQCIECEKKQNEKYYKTKKGLITKIYNSQKQSSKRRGHIMPEYTRKELQAWLFAQTLFHKLYSEWKNSGFEKKLIPSVDRKDDNIHYHMSNIQLMTWEKNSNKAHDDFKSGKLFNKQTPVIQLTMKNEFIAEYISQAEASRQTGINRSKITLCCQNKRIKSGGYKWKYKE